MLLVIDVGNTNITLGVFEKRKIRGDISHDGETTKNFG